jgi:tetratricopeptide (TPR) repeat protein
MIGALAIVAAGIPVTAAAGQAAAPPKQRALKSQEEQKALQALFQATTPDARVTAGEDFVTKFPKSDFRCLALFAEAQSYQQKGDYDKMVIYGERTLDADPDDATKLQTMLLLANGIAQRTREFDLDREEKLGRVEKYANSALETLKTIAKPNPNLPDEQWDGFKAQMVSDAHEALGMAALVRKNYDQAISEFKTAVAATKEPEPAAEVRLAAAYNKAGKYDDAIAICDRLMAKADLHPAIRQFAQSERARAVQAKGGAQATPAPAAGSAAPAAAPAPATPAPKP